MSDEIVLSVRDLKVWFPIRKGVLSRTHGWIRAVDGVSFDLRRGETLGLVGSSGCGKSTTARAILGLTQPTSGSIALAGEGPRWALIQAVFQDPLAALNPRHAVRDLLTEAAVCHGRCARAERDVFAERLLLRVGMDRSALDRYPHEFSGGQRQRLCIARALALEPKILVCDEAVSALDLSLRAQVLDLLDELKRELGLTVLFITHDLGVVRHVADRVLVMERGRIVESGNCADVLGNPQSDCARRLIASVPRLP